MKTFYNEKQVVVSLVINNRFLLYLFFMLCLANRPLVFGQSNNARNVAFNFSLSANATTSAGAFAKDGTLLKTIWSGKTFPAGTHTQTWDRQDDEGRLVPDGEYDIRILSNNVSYTWEGVVGNTSTNNVGASVHRWSDRIYDIRVIGDYAYFVTGYSEGQPSQRKFNVNTPNLMEEIWTKPNDIKGSGLMSHVLCSDANTIYWSGYDTGKDVSCIWATSITTGAEVNFSAGKPHSSAYGRKYASVVDMVPGQSQNFIYGIAVSSQFIFVARPLSNSLHVLNKSTGALVKELIYNEPRVMYVDKNDKLWLISKSGVTRHTINANGTISGPNMTLTGLSQALSIQVSADNNTVLVGDGGIDHVYKAFSNLTGRLLWTVGKPGGYSTSPDLAYDKFSFRTSKKWKLDRDSFDATFGALQPDGTLWLGDMGNQRIIHFAADRTTVMHEVINMGYSYQAAIDRANPSRVFSNYFEFEVDHTKPLQAGNGSWKLKRNWSWKVTGIKDDQYNRTRNIITLSNGKTYNIIRYLGIHEIVEYAATGLRYTGITFPATEIYTFYQDGSLWSITNGGVGQTIQYKRRPLLGFDASNNPQFGPAVVVEKTPTITNDDPVGHAMGGWNANQYTSSNILVTLATETAKVTAGQLRGAGYHLGGLKNGKWLWRTAKSTTRNYEGAFPSDGTYDVGNGVVYAGNQVTTLDRNIFWGYNGEFWKNSQTNKYNHVYDNGLFVGQFGVVGPETDDIKAFPGYAGNALVWGAAKVGDAYYLYHSDEGQHGALHRWKISNLNSIQEQIVPVTINTATETHGLTAEYAEGPDLNNLNIKTSRVDSTVDFTWNTTIPPGTALTNPANFSVRWKGYVQPAFSENYTFHLTTFDGVRLWVDGKLLIDKWTNNASNTYNSTPIPFVVGKRYSIELEYANKNSNSGLSLSWSSSRQPKQKIPSASLYPAIAPDRSGGFSLMEGLRYNSTLENDLYGWSRTPATDYALSYSNYWEVTTNVQTLNRENPDLFIKLKAAANGLTTTVNRDLGTPANLTEWSITGRLIWPKDDFDQTTDKGHFEILDVDGKPIARINRTFAPYPIGRLYANDKILIEGHKDTLSKVTADLQPFTITVKNDQVTVQYGPYAPVTTTLLDPASKWQQPKTLRVLYYSPTNKEHVMGLADMRYAFKTGLSITVKPTLRNDDGENTLKAAHALGTSEIMVSENGGAYKAYMGVIDVGNVARPAGYWKFKLKESPSRPGSDAVLSPAFTVSRSSSNEQTSLLNLEGGEAKVVTFPNPVRGELYVQYPAVVQEGSLLIVAPDGTPLKNYSLKAGNTKTYMDVSLLPGGTYFVKYKNGSQVLMSRFIKH